MKIKSQNDKSYRNYMNHGEKSSDNSHISHYSHQTTPCNRLKEIAALNAESTEILSGIRELV